MSAEEPSKSRAPRFNAAAAREQAQQARAKAEFILSRAYGLFREPKKEWAQIRDEDTNILSILAGYVAPLAAIPPICGVIGAYVFGFSYGGVDVRPPVGQALTGAIISFLASVALVYFLGILINAIAENFEAEKNELAAQKVAAYSMTPAFLSGVFSLWPPLWWLSLFFIAASVFLFYRGLPILMKAPETEAMSYTASVAVAGIVAFIVLFSLTSCVT